MFYCVICISLIYYIISHFNGGCMKETMRITNHNIVEDGGNRKVIIQRY